MATEAIGEGGSKLLCVLSLQSGCLRLTPLGEKEDFGGGKTKEDVIQIPSHGVPI